MVNYACAAGVLCRAAGSEIGCPLPTNAECNICDTAGFHIECVTPLMSIFADEAALDGARPEIKAALERLTGFQAARAKICVPCAQTSSEGQPAGAGGRTLNHDESYTLSSPSKAATSSARLSGTPASQQRPFKIRPTATTPQKESPASAESVLRDVPNNYLAANSPVDGLVPPPETQHGDIDTDFAKLFVEEVDEEDEEVECIRPPALQGHPEPLRQLKPVALTASQPSGLAADLTSTADTINATVTKEEFEQSIPKGVKERWSSNGYRMREGVPIKDGAAPGFKAPPTESESKTMDRLLEQFKWARVNKRWDKKPNETLTRGFHGTTKLGVEEMANYQCSTAGCKCELKLARFKGGIIAYDKCDGETNIPYQHTGHNLRPEEQKNLRADDGRASKTASGTASSKYDVFSLTSNQKEFVAKCDKLVASSKYYDIAKAMVADPTVCCTSAQKGDLTTFGDRIRKYVAREKTKGVQFNDEFSGQSLEEIFDKLKQEDRTDLPTFNDTPFAQTSDFKDIWTNIKVVDHDYQGAGGTFDHILFEYTDASERATKAAAMLDDHDVQLEMDFFHVPGVDGDWQVGHIGFSDLNHRYYILSMIICHSENSEAARLILSRAIDLVKEGGGKVTRVLVDGGKALNKAIGDESQQREFLKEYTVEKRRCFAHIIRMPFSRGGGYRGGKGSLPKALLDNGVPREVMGKIVGYILMMSFISPHDHRVFEVATEMLKDEFKRYLSPYIVETYLNGNPNDLGGACAGPCGTVASNQGGERRGGWIKKLLLEVMESYHITKTKCPLYFLIAAARDASRYNSKGAKGIQTEPNRKKFEPKAYKQMMTLSKYTPPREDKSSVKRNNFSSDFLYAVALVKDGMDVVEVPLHSVLGTPGQAYQVFLPSMATQFTSLRHVLLYGSDIQMSGPMAFMEHGRTAEDVVQLTSNPTACVRELAGLEPLSCANLKTHIRDCYFENSFESQPGETLKHYLRRHCKRDEASAAVSRFGDQSLSVSQKKASRKGRARRGGNKGEKEAELEAIKWGESAPANSTAWLNLACAQLQGERISKERLLGATVGTSFAILHGYDSSDVNKKARRIIKKVVPGWWYLQDEMGLIEIGHLQDSEDGGPVSQWGLWFLEPGQEHIEEAKGELQSSGASGKGVAKPVKARTNAAKHPRKGSGARGPNKSRKKRAKKIVKKGRKKTDIEIEMEDFMDGFELIDLDAEEEEIARMAMYADTTNNDESNLNFDFVFNDEELKEMNRNIREGLSLRVLRELGVGVTITVKPKEGEGKEGVKCSADVSCDCEKYIRWKLCRHVVYFEYLHNGRLPEASSTDANENWVENREKILKFINSTHIDICQYVPKDDALGLKSEEIDMKMEAAV